jgi:hypothetical protein
MAEKCTAQLPPLRVSERLERALMRGAARDDRALSDYIRRALELHCFGHVGGNGADDSDGLDELDASHCDARSRSTRRRGGDR